MKPKRRKDISTTVAQGAGALLGSVVGAAGGWIAYSDLAIDHQVPLPKAIEAETRTFESPAAGQLNVYIDRNATGTPLVLVHSVNAAASAYEMGPIFERYRGRRPVFTLDLPGFGFSTREERPYSPALFAGAIGDLLRTQAGGPADVVALSLGCEFAARAALSEPALFRSLTLISPSGFSSRTNVRGSQRARSDGQSGELYRALSFPLWGRPLFDLIATRRSIRFFLQQSFVGHVPQEMIDYAYASSHQPGAQHAPLYFVSGQLFTPDVRQELYAKLACPVLVVYDEDAFTGFDYLPEFVSAHPNWKAVRLQPTRGLPQFEKMDELAKILDEFRGG